MLKRILGEQHQYMSNIPQNNLLSQNPLNPLYAPPEILEDPDTMPVDSSYYLEYTRNCDREKTYCTNDRR